MLPDVIIKDAKVDVLKKILKQQELANRIAYAELFHKVLPEKDLTGAVLELGDDLEESRR